MTNVKIEPNRRLYDGFLLNKWICKPENHRRLIKYIFSRSSFFVFKCVEAITNFQPICYNPEKVENSSTERFKEYLRSDPEAKTRKVVEDIFYERYAKDYLIKATIVDSFELKHDVSLLCLVRARFARSSLLNHHICDLQTIKNEGLYDSKLQQLNQDDDQLLLINDKTFETVLITNHDSKGYPLPAGGYPFFARSGVMIFRVPKEEVRAVERESKCSIK